MFVHGTLMCVVTNLGLRGVVPGLALSYFRVVVNLLICLVDHAAAALLRRYTHQSACLCCSPAVGYHTAYPAGDMPPVANGSYTLRSTCSRR